MIEIVLKLPDASIDQVLLETMKEGKSFQEITVIQTYSFLFIQEFRHFLKVQGFLVNTKQQQQLPQKPISK